MSNDVHMVMLFDRVRRIAHTMTAVDLADDIASEVMLKVMEQGLVEPLPFIQLKHMLIDALRVERRHGHEPLVEGTVAPTIDTPEAREAQLAATLHSVQLSSLESSVVYLHFWQDLELSMIAEQLRTSRERVKLALQSAVSKLRKEWEDRKSVV